MERSSDRVCTRCEAVMWTGDRSCPRCGEPRRQAAPVPAGRDAAAPAWSTAAQHDDDQAPWQTSGTVTTAQQQRDAPPPPPQRRRKNGVLIAAAVLLVVAVIVAGVVLWRTGALGGDAETSATPGPTPSASEPAADPPPSDEPSEPPTDALPTTGDPLAQDASAQAPSTSADATDGNGDTTSYQASNMLDGDPETTWRMDGDGSGETITFTFDGERTISEVGLINGYAKTDPASGADRYAQTRRITGVTWTIGADSFDQRLDDDDMGLQTLAVRPVQGDTITLTIDGVTQPGNPTFDQTAISEVEILG